MFFLRLENIRSSLLNREICLVIYPDLSSAFDRVHHVGLLSKLTGAGIKVQHPGLDQELSV